MHRCLAFGAPEYTLTREQWVPQPPERVFPFFENPHNLPLITPPWLGFRVSSVRPRTVGPGTVIVYRLHWFRIPYRWRTLISEWVPNRRFVDVQLGGPYVLWHHTHAFEERRGGTLLKDRVRYRLPFGPLGVLTHALLVRRQLEGIFDYRARKIAALFADDRIYRRPPEE
jgi:ligand-binding SRPBCC domain-containing protein